MKPTYDDLKKKVELYEYILDNVNAGIWLNRSEGIAVWHNRKIEEIIERSVDEINEIGLEEYAKNYYHPDDEYMFQESLTHLMDKNIGHCTCIYRQKDRNGEWMKLIGTAKVSKRYANGLPEEVVSCGIIISEELADFTKIESLLKENAYLKNEVIFTNLTKRELELLKCIAQGKSTKQIADDKHISFHTVESHRKNIMKKLKVNNLADLVRLATECGLY